MKKFFSLVAVALVAMSAFVSCNKDDDSQPSNSGNGGSESTELSDSVQIGIRISQTGYCTDEEYTQIRSRLYTFFKTKLGSILKAGGTVQLNGFTYKTSLTDTAMVNKFIRTTLTDEVMKKEYDVDASGVVTASLTVSSYSEKCGEKKVYSYGYNRQLATAPVGTWSTTVDGTNYSLTIHDQDTGTLTVGGKTYDGTMKHYKGYDSEEEYSVMWQFYSNETKLADDGKETSTYILGIVFCYTTTDSFVCDMDITKDGGGYDDYDNLIFKK